MTELVRPAMIAGTCGAVRLSISRGQFWRRRRFDRLKPPILNDECAWHADPTDFEGPLHQRAVGAAVDECDSDLSQAARGLIDTDSERGLAETNASFRDCAREILHRLPDGRDEAEA